MWIYIYIYIHFAQRSLYTKELIQTVTRRSFYTEELTDSDTEHKSADTKNPLHTDPFTRRNFDTENLWQRGAFTLRGVYIHTQMLFFFTGNPSKTEKLVCG